MARARLPDSSVRLIGITTSFKEEVGSGNGGLGDAYSSFNEIVIRGVSVIVPSILGYPIS